MAKIVKQKYTKADGTKDIYGYLVPVKKELIINSGIDVEKPIKIEMQKGKIIVTN